jgi:hypothetical protein
MVVVVVSLGWLTVASAARAVLHPGQYSLNTVTLDQAHANPGGGYLTCKNPSAQRIVTGGMFWHAPGQGPNATDANSYLMGSSAATLDAKGWFADGTSDSSSLTVTALCLPKSQVGTYTVKTRTFNVPTGSAAGGYVECPQTQRIVTGGAFWHQPGQGPDPGLSLGVIGSSSATLDARGWYADGEAFTDSQLTITALCLPTSRLGTYTLRTRTFNQTNGVAGGYLKCPKSQRIVAGGAFWHQPGKGPDPSNVHQDELGSSSATLDAKGWYADGQVSSSSPADQLTLVAQCLPA